MRRRPWVLGGLALAVLASTVTPAAADDPLPGSPVPADVSAPADVTAPGDVTAPSRPRVDRLLDRRLHDPRLGRNVGLFVVDARTGSVLSAHGADRPLQAASNMKLLTAVTSIATMGPQRRFRTTVAAVGPPGHVVLRGGGDPLLSRAALQRLAAATARKLPRRADVVVHIDGSLFAPVSPAPGWVPAYVGSSVGMVQSLAIRGDRSRTPARHAAQTFASALRSTGVRVRIGPPRAAGRPMRVLARTAGHTVAESVAVMLNASESGVAEVLFRQVAIATGRQPTWAGGQRAARETLTGLGIDTTGAILVDGSGLSRRDRISPRLVVDVLRVARVTQRSRFRAMFAPTALPVAGRTGTLATAYGRYSTAPSRCARGAVRAKTGTILGTIALSGVARTVFDGRRIFSIIVNDRPARYSALSTRRAVDGLAATITGCWD